MGLAGIICLKYLGRNKHQEHLESISRESSGMLLTNDNSSYNKVEDENNPDCLFVCFQIEFLAILYTEYRD